MIRTSERVIEIRILILSDQALDLALEKEVAIRYYDVNKLAFKNCSGCFSCWKKSERQGQCIYRDIAEQIRTEFIESDFTIVISEVVFGGYSSKIKKVFDRFIPLIPPLTERKENRIIHIPLFPRYPSLLFIGIGEQIVQEEQETFQLLAAKNAAAFYAPSFETLFLTKQNISKCICDRITSGYFQNFELRQKTVQK